MTPYPFYFEVLRDLTAGSVCDTLPIVFFEDRADNPYFTNFYRHVDFLSVYVARQGTGIHYVEGVPFEVQAGDVYAMGLGMSHRFDKSDSLILDAVHFRPDMFSPQTLEALAATVGMSPLFLRETGGGARWLRLSPAARVQASEMIREMRQEWEIDTPDRALMVQATFIRFLIFLARSHPTANRSASRMVSRACALIESRYAEPLKIGDLAASAFLSTGRFTELFRSEVGCSPRDYLGQVRVQAAKRLLKETELSVSAIAAQTGFPDPAYFTRFFRQQVGFTPSEFRRD